MSLGNKIVDLRKKNGLSQEQLAEKLSITRQTISNWETGQTTPDIDEAKKISQIFKISLDELLDNDVSGIISAKISNTEKLAGMIIKILKVFGVVLIVYFVAMIIIVAISWSTFSSNEITEGEMKINFNCSLNNSNYDMTISSLKKYECLNCSSKIKRDTEKLIDYDNLNTSTDKIQEYFVNQGGNCD